MYEEILELLKGEYPEIDFESSEKLIDDGIVDSITKTELIALFTLESGIEIPMEETVNENFNSLRNMADMVERLKQVE